jgi:SAM-dependent methyltransferase
MIIKHKNTKTQKHKNTKTQKHKNTKTQKHKNTKTQKLKENNNLINVFTKIYETDYWGDNNNPNYEGSSGIGSAIWYNKKTYIPFIHKFLKKYKIKSVVDLGCGDFRIGVLLYGKTNITYTGYDAYKTVIDYNNDKFKNYKTFNFIHSDFTSVKERKNINTADVCIIKDVLQHLPTKIIIQFMNYIIKSHKFKYILLINCYNTTPENTITFRKDIKPGEFSSLSALKYPLNKYGGKVIYKWDTKEVSLIRL